MSADAHFWDKIAEKYAAKPLPNPASTARKLEIIREGLEPTAEVVDLGCGTGTIVLELARDVARIHGVDVSGEMINIARRKADDQGADNVDFRRATVSAGLDGFSECSLDGVLAFNILHLVSDWREALTAIHQRLRPGGLFASSTVCLGDSWVPYRPILAVLRWLGKAPPVEIIRSADLEATMASAGFVDIERPDVDASSTTAFLVARRPLVE
jgi:2-polyprenyl-3-methyl-5-hydroxy-6-metoxy-1,4-benzoquinol methylase